MDTTKTGILRHYLRKIRIFSPPCITSGKIAVFACREGFKIFHAGDELTKNVGLNVSWNHEGRWADCSSFSQEILLHKPGRIMAVRKDELHTILFDLEFISPGTLNSVIRITSQENFSSPKVSVMLQDGYKNWLSPRHEGPLPVIRAFHEIGIPDPAPAFIGAGNISEGRLVPFLIRFRDAAHYIQNSDALTGARILCAEMKGVYTEACFEGGIQVFPDRAAYRRCHNFCM